MRAFPIAGLIASLIGLSGCGSNSVPGPVDGPTVEIRYQSDPLGDVEVRLHASPTGPVIAKAISSADGVARFADVPSPEPDKYAVSLASVGDGGWILDTDYLDPAESLIELKPLAAHDGQRIELPDGVVRPLER